MKKEWQNKKSKEVERSLFLLPFWDGKTKTNNLQCYLWNNLPFLAISISICDIVENSTRLYFYGQNQKNFFFLLADFCDILVAYPKNKKQGEKNGKDYRKK